jgi:hypothetical protein
MSDAQTSLPAFASQYGPLSKEVFTGIARKEIAEGADADERARAYAERGKPEFALAFLLLGELPDDERRVIFAYAHERRAANTEQRAREFDRNFHRPFPLLAAEAAHDRALARQIRVGQALQHGAGKQLPLL